MDPKTHFEGWLNRLGRRLFESSEGMEDDLQLLRIASADMTRLAEATGESVVLAVIDGSDALYVCAEQHRDGERASLWDNAIGRALAASLAPDARERLVEGIDPGQLTEIGFPGHRAFAAHLDLVRARGYAVDVDEAERGTSAVAAPILDRQGQSIGAIGIEGPSERLRRARLHELGPLVVEATRSASRYVGGAPRPLSQSPRPSTVSRASVKTLVETRNLIGEAPVYDVAKDRLFWVDMYDPAIYRFERKNRELVTFSPGEMVMALALVPEGLLAASQSGLWLLDPESGDRIRYFGHPEGEIPTNRFNDGKIDSRGRFWVNTMNLDFGAKAGALYRLDPDGTFARMETGLSVPNGMDWSPDNRTMYLVDTAERTIYAYDFRKGAGDISNRRVFARLPTDRPGAPDGLAVDTEGNIWVAVFDGWRINKFSPAGELTEEVVMPVPRPTSCVVGGLDQETLFVTSARLRVSASTLKEAPHSGGVFEVRL